MYSIQAAPSVGGDRRSPLGGDAIGQPAHFAGWPAMRGIHGDRPDVVVHHLIGKRHPLDVRRRRPRRVRLSAGPLRDPARARSENTALLREVRLPQVWNRQEWPRKKHMARRRPQPFERPSRPIAGRRLSPARNWDIRRSADFAAVEGKRPEIERSFDSCPSQPRTISRSPEGDHDGKNAAPISGWTARGCPPPDSTMKTAEEPGTTFSLRPVQYAIQCPSGEKRGLRPPDTSNIGSPPSVGIT